MRMEQQIFDGSWIVGLQATQVYLETSKNFYEKTLLEVKEGVIKLYSLVSILKEGFVKIRGSINLDENNASKFKQKEKGYWLAISSGTIEMNANKIIVLAD